MMDYRELILINHQYSVMRNLLDSRVLMGLMTIEECKVAIDRVTELKNKKLEMLENKNDR